MPFYSCLSESGSKQEQALHRVVINIVFFRLKQTLPRFLFHAVDFLQNCPLSLECPRFCVYLLASYGVSELLPLPFPFPFGLNWMLKTLTVPLCFLSLSHTFCDTVSSLKGQTMSYPTLLSMRCLSYACTEKTLSSSIVYKEF